MAWKLSKEPKRVGTLLGFKESKIAKLNPEEIPNLYNLLLAFHPFKIGKESIDDFVARYN